VGWAFGFGPVLARKGSWPSAADTSVVAWLAVVAFVAPACVVVVVSSRCVVAECVVAVAG